MNLKIASILNMIAAIIYLLSNSIVIALSLVLIALFYYDTYTNGG